MAVPRFFSLPRHFASKQRKKTRISLLNEKNRTQLTDIDMSKNDFVNFGCHFCIQASFFCFLPKFENYATRGSTCASFLRNAFYVTNSVQFTKRISKKKKQTEKLKKLY